MVSIFTAPREVPVDDPEKGLGVDERKDDFVDDM